MPPKKVSHDETKIKLGRPGNTLKMGIIGLPNVGKSSTFNLLTKLNVPATNIPFCTKEPNIAQVNVPDSRFQDLVDHYKPKTQIMANLKIYDIAGLVRNAHNGEGLGNSFLSHIHEVDGLYHLVRAFDDSSITHYEMDVDPIRDLEIIHEELLFKDLDILSKRVAEIEQKMSRSSDKSGQAERETLLKAKEQMEKKKWIKEGDWTAKDIDILNQQLFLTAKPVVYLINLSAADFERKKNKWLPKIKQWVEENCPGDIIPYSVEYEQNLEQSAETSQEKPEQQKQQKKSSEEESKDPSSKALLPPTNSMLNRIIRSGFKILDLINFYTTLSNEIKAWTIRQGTHAQQAAGVIHTDMERGFISAEVMKFDDWKQLGSENAVKAEGKYYQKGKEYVVQDGDIICFKFNVTTQPAKKK